ncbi:MAG: TonB family protein [Nitrospirota bacterium]
MTLSLDEQHRMQGWAVSAIVHGLALTVALGLMAQVKPAAPKEAFKWDVALIEPEQIQEAHQAESKPTNEPAKPTPRRSSPVPSQPQVVRQEVQPREVTPVVQRELRQVVETSEPIQQTVALEPRTESVTPIREQKPAEVQQTKQAVVESVAPVLQHEEVTAVSATPAAQESQPVITEASLHPVETRTAETASVTQDSDPPAPSAPPTAAANEAKPAESVARESAPQVAMATRPAPTVKADHGWLAESLWRRVAELKRYPSAARLNGWEGKVVLRVVIRADGQLADVKIQKSSGYDALDRAALEAIRLACPLHMKHELHASEVAMNLPIVYSLAN